MAVLTLVICSCIISWLIWMLVRYRETISQIIATRRAAAKFPGLKPHWLYGNFDQEKFQFSNTTGKYVAPAVSENKYEFSRFLRIGLCFKVRDSLSFAILYQELTEKHKRMFVFWSGPLRPVLTLVHPETVKYILKSSEPKTHSLGAGYRLLEDWIGDGLLLSKGEKWERNRKLLTPAFHFAILKPYQKQSNPAIKTFLNKMASASKQSEFVEIFAPVGLLTLEIMLRCAFSYEGQIQEQGDTHPYVEAIHQLSELLLKRAINPLLMFNTIYRLTSQGRKWREACDTVHNFSKGIIDKRRKTLSEDPEASKNRHLDFLDILLTARDEDGIGLTETDIRDEVDTFLFEGHDTTASAASWALYALAKYPEEQDKVYQEVQAILGDKEEVEWEDLPKLNQTKIFLKEVMRFFSPVYQISRETTKPCEIDGHKIPVGMSLDINIMNINHNPVVWENHKIFDSSRFETDEFIERDPFIFIPFSAGPRNCIGQNFAMNELKSVLVLTLQRYRLEVDPDHEYIPSPCVVMRAQNGINLKFIPRNNQHS